MHHAQRAAANLSKFLPIILALLLGATGVRCGGSKNSMAQTSTGAPSAQPTPPSSVGPNATVFSNVQQATGWQTCGACGNTGGGGNQATFSMTRGISTPSLSGSSAEFAIGGSFPFANAYWFLEHPAPKTGIKALIYEFDLFVPAGSENAPQAIEFECQQRLDGFLYNFGWQALYPGNTWRVFNYDLKKWEDTGIALQRFSPNTWHHIRVEHHNDPVAHITFHDGLTVDGVRHAMHITHAATVINTGNEFENAFQLDLNGTPTAFQVYVDNMQATLDLF